MKLTINKKEKRGFFPMFFMIMGILFILFGLLSLINKDYFIFYFGIVLILIGAFITWDGYSLRKYGKIIVPTIFKK